MVIFGKAISIENAHIASLFLFQYSLVMLLTYIFDATVVIMTSTLILMWISALVNGLEFKYSKCILCFFSIMIILVSKCLWCDEHSLYPVLLFVEIAFPVLFILAKGFNFDRFIHFSYKLAYINFFAIALYPFIRADFNYMRFGYGMLLTVVFLYVKFSSSNKRNWFDILFLMISFFMMLFYGARGAVFSFLVMVVIDRLLIKKNVAVKNIITLLMIGLLSYNFESVLKNLHRLASAIGIRSYVLDKLSMQLNSGIEVASSGRDRLYRNAIEMIYNNWAFGGPLWSVEDGTMYAHNLFLQAGLEFGILGIIVMVLFVIVVLCQIWNSARMKHQCYVLSVLFSIAIGRLMFSSIYWRRPEFWMLLFTFLIVFDNKNMWYKKYIDNLRKNED